MTAPTQQAPVFSVVKGNPNDEELTALTTILAQLHAEAKKAEQPAAKNLWGVPGPLAHPQPIFNAHAFANVTYF